MTKTACFFRTRGRVAIIASIALLTSTGEARAYDPKPIPDPDPPMVALLIGIADYQHFTDDGKPGQTDLRGPGNDVERMRKSLERFGFTGENVRIVRDSEATRDGIADAFRWIADRASDGDASVVVYFSGHGSFAKDRDGDEAESAPGDTLDEGLVPWDAQDIHDPDQLVLDDQIRSWLAEIPTDNVTVIVDACYSGTVTRGELGATPKGPLAPGGSGTGLDLATGPGHTLITAASPAEPAYEWRPSGSDLIFGKLTYYLTRALAEADPTDRYDDVMRRVRRDVSSSGSPNQRQTPQLEGDRGARIFHVRGDVPRRAYVTVSHAADAFSIDEGAVHGVRRGALYDVYPRGDTEFRGEALATLRVEEIDLERARAVPVNRDRSVPEGARGVLSRVPPGAERIDRIQVHLEPGTEEIADTLRGLPFVDVTAESTGAHARLSKAGDGYVVLVGGDSLPPQDEDVEAGRTTTEPRTAYRGTVDALCRPLRRAFAIASFDAIENPIDVPGWVEVQLALVPPGEPPPRFFTAAPDTVVVGRNYHLWARVDAEPEHSYYLSIAIEGYTSEPAVLFPPAASRSDRFPLNQWVRVTRRPLRPEEPAGAEQLVAVATPVQFDLHSLVTSFPNCATTRSKGDEAAELADQPARHWQSFRHDVVIKGGA